jgi:GTP-binding protein EngB required for normal cell division
VNKVLERSTDVTGRLDALAEAVDAANGRLDVDLVDSARAVIDRAEVRMRLSADHTVVAVAGATGSGKSSLFNAISGLELAAVGVRRPTTSTALACVWGAEGAGPLLDWLGIPKRHQLSRSSDLDTDQAEDAELNGLVLLDLPDHDSTEVQHRVEVDRLVELVDMLVWVVDPQKYADHVLHERYLRRLAAHREVVALVLNRVDQLTPAQARACVADLEHLLREDGLGGVPVLQTSAATGQGTAEFRAMLAERVAAKRAASARLAGDAVQVADRLAAECGEAKVPEIAKADRRALVSAFADAAGVPIVVDAVARSYRLRAKQATGWPLTKWLVKVRPDPLRRLHLRVARGLRERSAEDTAPKQIVTRSSLPEPTPVQRARVDTAVRRVVDSATRGLNPPWVAAVRRAARERESGLSDALDQAVVGTDLGVARAARWWTVVRVLQWIVFVVAVVGGLWLGALFGAEFLRLPGLPDPPAWNGIPIPTIGLVGGVVVGLLLALVSRLLAGVGSQRRARVADRRMRESIAEVADRLVFTPVEEELSAYRTCRDALATVRQP